MQLLINVAIAFGIAGVVSFASTPLVKHFATTVGAIDVPQDDRRMHKVPVARLGGLAIFFGFFVAVLLYADFLQINGSIKGMLIGAVIIVVLGCVDDVVRLPAWIKFIVQIGAALVPVLMSEELRITALSNPLGFWGDPYINLGALSIPVTVVWIVAITNAVNFIDGLDGLAAGVSAISSISLLVLALVLQLPEVAIIMAALSGGCIGFMPYNVNPAKLFMGDTGATFLGFILAVTSIQGLFKFYTIISFAVPFLVLGLPIFDVLVSVFRRVSKGQSPAAADRSHIHHHLIDMGFSQKQSVAILYAISAILGVTAVISAVSGEIRAILFLLAVVVALVIGIRVFKGAGAADKGEAPPAEEGGQNDEPPVEPPAESPAAPEPAQAAPEAESPTAPPTEEGMNSSDA